MLRNLPFPIRDRLQSVTATGYTSLPPSIVCLDARMPHCTVHPTPPFPPGEDENSGYGLLCAISELSAVCVVPSLVLTVKGGMWYTPKPSEIIPHSIFCALRLHLPDCSCADGAPVSRAYLCRCALSASAVSSHAPPDLEELVSDSRFRGPVREHCS